MSKTFESLFELTDPISGEQLEWEWDDDNRVFTATDRTLRTYTITPITAEMEVDASGVEKDGEDDDDDSD